MIPPLVRVVDDDDVAGGEGGAVGDGGLDGGGHGPQVDGDMGGLGQQTAVAQKHGTAKIEPLFDVGAVGGALQRHPHLLSDGGKEIGENGQGDGRWIHKLTAVNLLGA